MFHGHICMSGNKKASAGKEFQQNSEALPRFLINNSTLDFELAILPLLGAPLEPNGSRKHLRDARHFRKNRLPSIPFPRHFSDSREKKTCVGP